MSEFEFRKKVSIGKISRSIVPKNSKISIRDYFIETESFRIFIRFLIRNVIFRKFSTSFSTKIFGVLVRFGDLVQWWVVLPICDVGNALMNTRLRENDVIELKRPVSHRFFDLGKPFTFEQKYKQVIAESDLHSEPFWLSNSVFLISR